MYFSRRLRHNAAIDLLGSDWLVSPSCTQRARENSTKWHLIGSEMTLDLFLYSIIQKIAIIRKGNRTNKQARA